MNRIIRFVILCGLIVLCGFAVTKTETLEATVANALPDAAQIANMRVVSVVPNVPAGQSVTVERFAKFELAFDIPNRNFESETNPYFPYGFDLSSLHADRPGISVDLLLISPTVTAVPDTDNGWDTTAKLVPCFYYQSVDSNLQPENSAHWRCRLSADVANAGNTWKYRVRVVDGGGRSYEPASPLAPHSFLTIPSNRKGNVRIQTQNGMTTKYFEFADGTPFVYPLTNIEWGNPLNKVTSAEFESMLQELSERGHHFVRWFPTDQGANYFIIPYAGDIKPSWNFNGGVDSSVVDKGAFSYKLSTDKPAQQPFLALADKEFLMTLRVNISGTKKLRAVVSDLENPLIVEQTNGWETRTRIFVNHTVAVRNLVLNVVDGSGDVRVGLIRLQQRAKGSNDAWGPNLLTRGDPNTHEYVDQVAAARLDKILELSEQYNLYHKLPLFNKEDGVLARIQPNGTLGPVTMDNFYSAGVSRRLQQEVYTRYFIARWSYSSAIHSLELANENNPRICVEDRTIADPASKPCTFTKSADAAYSFAEFVLARSPRKILMSNSFWADWSYAQLLKFWNDPTKGPLLDYADIHWYGCDLNGLNRDACKGNSHSLITWKDSAAYVFECRDYFRDDIANAQRPSGDYYWPLYQNRPIVRGEGGIWQQRLDNQGKIIADLHPYYSDPTRRDLYQHKKLWAQVGVLTYLCDGEWYDRFNGQWSDYSAYQRFMANELSANHSYEEIYSYINTWGQSPQLKSHRITISGSSSNALRAVGLLEAATGRALLWIDNGNHTWQNLNGGTANPVSGEVIASGFAQGKYYRIEYWDTLKGEPLAVQPEAQLYFSTDGTVHIPVQNLTSDFAVKLYPLHVNSTADPGDGLCTSRECTLREAIILANSTAGAMTIEVPAGVYVLSVAGANEDAARTGDLDIIDALTLIGAGAESTIIDGNQLDRVFHVLRPAIAKIMNVTIRNGKAEVGGGIYNSSKLFAYNCTVTNNMASSGGGISNRDAYASIDRCQINYNRSFEGAGVDVYGSRLELTNSAVTDNVIDSPSRVGGGLYIQGDATISNSTISNNKNGDGIYIQSGSLHLASSLISNNQGNGLFVYREDDIVVDNSTFSGNVVGIVHMTYPFSHPQSGSLTLQNSTIVDNRYSGLLSYDQATVQNTVIAGTQNDPACNLSYPLTSLGYNLDNDGTCNLTSPTDKPKLNPQLGPLQDNGGTTWTHKPLAGSPLIDAGDNATCPATDQIGQPRPIDGDGDGKVSCDIGAFEVQQPYTDKARITLIKEALPDSPRNFRYWGAFGSFLLDDPGEDDGDSVKNFMRYSEVMAPGTYTFSEEKIANWFMTDIKCDRYDRATVKMPDRSVTLDVKPGDQIICTFINQYAASLSVYSYWDLDQDGQRDPTEDWQDGWWTEFYDSSGKLKASNFTSQGGHWDLYNIRPGRYTVCQKPRDGWSNTQPILTDPAHYNWPCYSFDLTYAQMAKLNFGYTDQPFAAPPNARSALDSLEIIEVADPEQDALSTWEEFLAVHPGDRLPDEEEVKNDIFLPMIAR